MGSSRGAASESDQDIPFYWGGLLRPLTRPEQMPMVLGALARNLAGSRAGSDEDRLLVRTRVSLDGPMRDRVWIDAETPGGLCTVRALLAHLSARGHDVRALGLRPWIESVRADYTNAFDLEPTEFARRCLPHYHGVPAAWTDEHYARAHYLSWSPTRRAEFAHEYLAYAEVHRPLPGQEKATWVIPRLQEAAAWLLSRRRYVFRWTVMTREQPVAPPSWIDQAEATLLEAAAAVQAHAASCPPPFKLFLDEELRGDSPPRADIQPLASHDFDELLEVLQRADCEPRRLRAIRLWGRLSSFREPADGEQGELAAALAVLRERLAEAGRWL
jgi:hypothetical protein